MVLSNFQRYFAPNVAAQIAQQPKGPSARAATSGPVVIFFSDIRGFTPMSETMNPDDVAKLLTEYFTEMVEIVFEHSAARSTSSWATRSWRLWGAPIAHEDDADRAMQCALDQLAALEKLNAMWSEQGRPPIEIGIGINFGEVFAGNIGIEPPSRVHRHRRRGQHRRAASAPWPAPTRSSSPSPSTRR